MKIIKKEIEAENGKLFCRFGNNRILLAECEIKIQIVEERLPISIIGVGKSVRRTNFVLLVTFNQQFVHEPTNELISKIRSFEAVGDIMTSNGDYKRFVFDNFVIEDLCLDEYGSSLFSFFPTREQYSELLKI